MIYYLRFGVAKIIQMATENRVQSHVENSKTMLPVTSITDSTKRIILVTLVSAVEQC